VRLFSIFLNLFVNDWWFHRIHVIQRPLFFSSHVDSDQTLLDRMKLVPHHQDYPLARHYARRVLSWGWLLDFGSPASSTAVPSSVTSAPSDIDVDTTEDSPVKNQQQPDDQNSNNVHWDELLYYLLFKCRLLKQPRSSRRTLESCRRFVNHGLFWSITVAISGVLGFYVLVNKGLTQ
jgi:hypothetical protein